MPNSILLDPTMTINEIVVLYPQAIPVFNRLGMDTCCGGGVALNEAAHRDGLDLDALLGDLRDAVERQ
jgi:regulator of cell morphogenesis and NO signaling